MLPFDNQIGPVGQDEKNAFVSADICAVSCFSFALRLESVTKTLLASGRCAGFLMTLPMSGLGLLCCKF